MDACRDVETQKDSGGIEMTEDGEFVGFIKSCLEDGVPCEAPRMAEIVHAATVESFSRDAAARMRRRRWAVSLVAASLVAVSSFAVLNLWFSRRPENTVACVIDLLRTADGAEIESGESSVAEMMLAWQDAPYESAVADIVVAN